MDKPVSHIELTNEIKSLIETTKQKVAQSINSSLTLLYWSIGHMLNNSLKKEYGEEIVATVSQQLQKEYGKGYSYSALTRMMKLAKLFDKNEIATLSQQLSWSHFIELIPLDDTMKLSGLVRSR